MVRIKCYRNSYEKTLGLLSDLETYEELLPDMSCQLVNGMSDIECQKYDIVCLNWNILYKKKASLSVECLSNYNEDLIVYVAMNDLYDNYVIDFIVEENGVLEMCE